MLWANKVCYYVRCSLECLGHKNRQRLYIYAKVILIAPTKEAFEENVKRAHYQSYVWRSIEAAESPVADPDKYGWTRDEMNRTLVPITVPETVSLAPASLMSLIRCGCASDPHCGSSRCGCRSANLSFTVFCACHDACCVNSHTRLNTQS